MVKTKKKSKKNSDQNLSPARLSKKATGELLASANRWSREKYSTDFSLKIYKYLISLDPESKEAAQARLGILQIAQRWNAQGRRYSALNLYKELINQKYE